MERDFLGINGKNLNLGSQVKEGRRQDSDFAAFLGGPFANKIRALQQFMSYRAGREEKQKKVSFDQFPSSIQDAFEKCFSFDQQSADQLQTHAHQSQSSSANPIPVAMSHPFFKIDEGSPYAPNGSISLTDSNVGSMVGTFAPRNASKQSAQMTFFYAGSVNVYDDVPLSKAQAIMTFASKESDGPPPVVNPRPEEPVSTICKVVRIEDLSMNQKTPMRPPTPSPTLAPNNVTSPRSGISTPYSVTSHSGNHNGSGSSTTDGMAVAKNTAPLAQCEPFKDSTAALASAAPVPVMLRAVPQSRKASLARFLDKRKERVTNVAPYSNSKKPMEN